MVNDDLVLAATWPPTADADQQPPGADPPPGRRALTVRLAGEVLGVLRLQEHDRQPLTPVEERLFAGLAAQAGLVLHGVRLRAELAQRVVELSARAEELRVSRERLVDTQDAERRRLERDIHDGAQQHLVALAVNLRLAQTLATRSPERARKVLAEQRAAARTTIDTLVDLSRGIYPRQLAEDGVGPRPARGGGDQPGPGHGRRRRGALRRRRGGGRLLLLPRGAPERRQARRRRPDRRRPAAARTAALR